VTADKHIWGIPTDTNTRFVYYRSDILSANGFSTPPDTWDKVLEMAKTITNPSQKIYGFASELTPFFGGNVWLTLVWAFGGDAFDPNTMEVLVDPGVSQVPLQALEFMQELVKYAPPGVLSWTDTEVQQALGSTGIVAWAFAAGDPTADDPKMSQYADKIAFDRPPATAARSRGSHSLSRVLGVPAVIPSTTKKPRQAFQFIEFIQRPSNLQKFIENTGQPGRPSALTAPYISSIPSARYLTALGQTLLNDARPPYPVPEESQIETIMGEEVANALTGKKDASTALKDMASRLTTLMKAGGYYG